MSCTSPATAMRPMSPHFRRGLSTHANGNIGVDLDGAVLKSAIEQVVFAAAPNDTRPGLAGVLMRLEIAAVTLAAADGVRLAARTITLADTTTRAAWIVPARTLVEAAHCLS